MAGRIASGDKTNLILAGIMAVALAIALIGGLFAIIRIGQPEGTTATLVAETSAWIFAIALLATFFRALRESLRLRHGGL